MKYYILKICRAPIGESGDSCKSTYHFDHACKACGTGAVLVGKLRTKGLSRAKADIFETLDDDCILSERLFNELKNGGVNLNHSNSVVDYRNNELPFYYLNTNIILPEAKMRHFSVNGQCPVCKRNGFWTKVRISDPKDYFPYDLHYSKEVLDCLEGEDFTYTWECMGMSNLVEHDIYVIRYARPLLIISEKFKTVLEKNKIRHLEFEEIYFDQ